MADSVTIKGESGGAIGIGTTSPADALHVKLSSGQRVARFESNDNTSAHIAFKAPNTSLMPTIGVKDEDLYISTGDAVERARFDADSNGDLILQTGNLVIGTAGKGIDFSANAHATDMTSELLDDYEEGECSLTMGGNTNIGTDAANINANNNYSGGQAFYVKIGCLCYIQAYFFSQSTTTQAAGELQIHGLPFTAHANGGSFSTQSYNLNLPATGDQVGIPMTSGGTQINYLLNRDSITWTSVNANVMPNNTAIYVRVAGTYKTV